MTHFLSLKNVAMIRILLLGASLIGLLFSEVRCSQSSSNYNYSKVKKVNVANYNKYFPKYCEIDSSINLQDNFTLCSFVGDYSGALKFATKHDIQNRQHNILPELSSEELENIKQELKVLLVDSSKNTVEQKAMIRMLSNIIEGNDELADIFKDRIQISAKKYIIAESSKYHFLLLNEAHYSSQNRAFTKELLKPLWEKGYRYLALETLGYTDNKLMQRGYPVENTGYYTKESVFGNLVREALLIGYKVIPYEAHDLSLNSTARDFQQAQNIYNSTIKTDSIGKVIIHGGYSHISEFPGIEYKPMGFQLGELVKQPILTIDQNVMTELYEEEVMHPYYRHALNTYKFTEPVVFLNNEGVPLVDPINAAGIDVQVYHPKTTYICQRPSWLVKDGYQLYKLNQKILEFKGNLLQAVVPSEEKLSVPVDQIIIKEGSALILMPGIYRLRIIDCNGTLIAEANFDAF